MGISGVIAGFLPQPWLTKLLNKRTRLQHNKDKRTPLGGTTNYCIKYPETLAIAQLLVDAGADPSIPAGSRWDGRRLLTALELVRAELSSFKRWSCSEPAEPLKQQQKKQMERFVSYLEEVTGKSSILPPDLGGL